MDSCSVSPVSMGRTTKSSYLGPLDDHDETEPCLIGYCSCPYYESGDLCKHIWASLRFIDEDPFVENYRDFPHLLFLNIRNYCFRIGFHEHEQHDVLEDIRTGILNNDIPKRRTLGAESEQV